MSKRHRRALKKMRLQLNHRLMNEASAPTHDEKGNRLGLRQRMAAAGFTDIRTFNQAMTARLEKLADHKTEANLSPCKDQPRAATNCGSRLPLRQ